MHLNVKFQKKTLERERERDIQKIQISSVTIQLINIFNAIYTITVGSALKFFCNIQSAHENNKI